jgi:K+-transporting ATPase A subunit
MLLNSLTCVLIFVASLLLALPLGAYMSKVYSGEKSLLDFLKPFERFIFKTCRINPTQGMNWKQYLIAMAVMRKGGMQSQNDERMKPDWQALALLHGSKFF